MRNVGVMGVPLDLGGSHRGVGLGTRSIRIAGLGEALAALGHKVHDWGDIDTPLPETLDEGSSRHKYLAEIAEACRQTKVRARLMLEAGHFPVFLGGDHSISIGTIAAVSAYQQSRGRRLGLIWFDAHGDFNTPESTLSGNIHGMPLAVVTGEGHPELLGIGEGSAPMVRPQDAALIGIRDVDGPEAERLRASKVNIYTMRDIDERGIKDVVQEALARVSAHTDSVHCSFDMDFVDPEVSPGVGTRASGGPDRREAHLAMELVADSKLVGSLDMVEVNPVFDERNRTSLFAVDLILSALGKRIL